MTVQEFLAWAERVPEFLLRGIRTEAQLAANDWRQRIMSTRELQDAAAWQEPRLISPNEAAVAAANAATELAAIVHVWPEKPHHVFRPLRRMFG